MGAHAALAAHDQIRAALELCMLFHYVQPAHGRAWHGAGPIPAHGSDAAGNNRPLHDALLLALWCWSFRRREVSWRQERFGIGRDGSLHRVHERRVPCHSGDIAE